jgi:MFS transporter, FLVCR family, feline leukemia virus subgroup C receptor-related protein
MFVQLGTALGFLIPPEIVTNGEDLDVTGRQLSIVMYGGAAVTTALFILVVIRMLNLSLKI